MMEVNFCIFNLNHYSTQQLSTLQYMKIRLFHQFLILLFFSAIFTEQTKANHIVGGDVTYKFIEFNASMTLAKFEVTFNMYRDTRSQMAAGFDEDAGFGIYRETSPGNWDHVETKRAEPSNPEDVTFVDDPCITEPSNVGVETGFYIFEVELPLNDLNYMVAYQRCCRNPTITNLVDPGDTGAAFNIIFTPFAREVGNNSPDFKFYPPLFICNQFNMDENVSGEDMDGDFLSYKFCTPTAAGGPGGGGCQRPVPNPSFCLPPFDEVAFLPPYSPQDPMGGDPKISINPFTGIISGVPTVEGQFIVGVCMEEYRDQKLLTIVNRDIQFNVLTCTKELTASIRADGTEVGMPDGVNRLVNIIKACGDSSVYFENKSFGNGLRTFDWTFYDKDGDVLFTRADNQLTNFNYDFPELGEYTGTLIVNAGSLCPDTAFFLIERLPPMETAYEYDSTAYDCYLGPVVFTDLSETEQATLNSWEWSFNGEESSTDPNPTYQFNTRGLKTVSLISGDTNGCLDTMTKVINYNPPHDEFLSEELPVTLCDGEVYDWYGEELTETTTKTKIVKYKETDCDSAESTIILDFSFPTRDVLFDTILCPGEVLTYLGQSYSQNGSYEDITRSRKYNCDSLYHYITLTYDSLPSVDFSSVEEYVEAFADYNIPTQITGDYAELIWTPTDGLSCDDCPRPTVNYGTDTTYNLQLITDEDCFTVYDVALDFVFIPDGYYIPTIISQNETNKVNRKFFVQTIDWAQNEVFYDVEIYDRYGGLMHSKRNISVNDESEAWQVYDVNQGVFTYVVTVYEFFEPKVLSGTVTVIK